MSKIREVLVARLKPDQHLFENYHLFKLRAKSANQALRGAQRELFDKVEQALVAAFGETHRVSRKLTGLLSRDTLWITHHDVERSLVTLYADSAGLHLRILAHAGEFAELPHQDFPKDLPSLIEAVRAAIVKETE